MTRFLTTLAAIALLCAVSLSAQGQGRAGGGPPPQRNLQVLPADIPQQQLIQIMQRFEQALGVGCEHCHVYQGRGNPANDLASDAKPEKAKTRAMMRMVRDINGGLPAAVSKPADQIAQVGCYTCHRGSAIPTAAPDLPAPPAGGGRQGGRQGGAE
ncbi:MAG: c-type cytochrome [Vicinamibacterales bacterium]